MILLRSALFNAYFYVVTTVACLIGVPARAWAPGWTSLIARRWAEALLAGARVICGIQVHITGLEFLPTEGPALLASQHQSAFDTLVWLTLLPRASYVVKQELTRIPLFGPMLLATGMIPVDRGAGANALRGLLRATDRAKQEDRHIVIFPEGTRVSYGEHVPLQPGIAAIASRQKLPVLPVATDSGRYWGRHAFRKYPGRLHIAIGAPIGADTPRPELLSRIEQFWRTAERDNFGFVDNSVGITLDELASTMK